MAVDRVDFGRMYLDVLGPVSKKTTDSVQTPDEILLEVAGYCIKAIHNPDVLKSELSTSEIERFKEAAPIIGSQLLALLTPSSE